MQQEAPSNIVSILLGADSSLGRELKKLFLDKGHTVLSVITQTGSDGATDSDPSKVNSSDTCDIVFEDQDVVALSATLLASVSDKLVTNLVVCHEYRNDSAVLHNPIQNWKDHSVANVELPLGILSALASQMNESSRILFLSDIDAFLPLKNNGFYAASKTAMAFLLHSLKLENPNYPISTGTIEPVNDPESDDSQPQTYSKEESYKQVAVEVLAALCLTRQKFADSEFVFPST